jgi:primosomal protein N' (replication factor Y)
VGTERVVEELQRLLPEARIGRMDLDSTRGKGGHRRVIESVKAHQVDILVGT